MRLNAIDPVIFLYGPPGSGKSTLGPLLAGSLGLSFVDLDGEIERQAGCSIPEQFARDGEAGFRRREREALAAALAPGERVVALGGGALLDPASRREVEARGPVLCLEADLETLAARSTASPGARPLLGPDQGQVALRLGDLLSRRAAHYASFPLRLAAGRLGPEQAAWEAQILLGRFRVGGMGAAYEVRVGIGSLAQLGGLFRRAGLEGPVAIACDANVAPLYLERAGSALSAAGYTWQPALIPAGEAHKNLETIAGLWDAFLAAGLDRGSVVLALGGGVTGDLAGFAASAFLRGVPWAVAPTTLLAMIDASLGGKTGFDLPQGKNLVGAFHPPRLVLADPQVLETLPEAELRSGLAEAVKHGVIGDPTLFALCLQGWDFVRERLDEIVRRAVAVKVRVIQADPYEKGQRAALNLGHTLGHAVELATGYRLRHGEAVSIGMAAAARLSAQLGLSEPGLPAQIEAVLRGLGLPVALPPGLNASILVQAMQRDKKRAAGIVRLALPVRVGEVRVGVPAPDLGALIEAARG